MLGSIRLDAMPPRMAAAKPVLRICMCVYPRAQGAAGGRGSIQRCRVAEKCARKEVCTCSLAAGKGVSVLLSSKQDNACGPGSP